jgi:hypothetical protein
MWQKSYEEVEEFGKIHVSNQPPQDAVSAH